MEILIHLLCKLVPWLISVKYLWDSLNNWYCKYENYKLDKKQVRENILNKRRYDWGTGKELNWRYKWNSNNPKEHKWIEFIFVLIKSTILFLTLSVLFRVMDIIIVRDIFPLIY
ncbi:hypothetical protein DWZ40_12785 [Clostridium sp. AF32-12BH]|nr:hypothetical protein DWZ40_12785 [Clostridium sp. AF32-12BH]